jgi:hypothetical protein
MSGSHWWYLLFKEFTPIGTGKTGFGSLVPIGKEVTPISITKK